MGEIFEKVLPREPLDWTGERLTTATSGQVEIEHLHRYFLAREFSRGLDVLDIASGEGYGSALIAQTAKSVVGVEISRSTVEHAIACYPLPNLEFRHGDARQIPLQDASVDLVVSFETLEHFFEHEQFIAEVRRVLRPGGKLVISSPERDVYSPLESSANPYHVHELSRSEFEVLLQGAFKNVEILLQRPMIGSSLVVDSGTNPHSTLTFEKRGANHYESSRGLPRPVYLIAVASDGALGEVPNSIFIQTGEVERTLGHAAMAASLEQVNKKLESEVARIEEMRRREQSTAQQALSDLEVAKENEFLEISRTNQELKTTTAMEINQYKKKISLLEESLESSEASLTLSRHQLEVMRRSMSQQASRTSQILALESLVATLEERATNWEQRYYGLRQRLDAILHRFGLIYVSRAAPRGLRTFIKERILGPRR